MFDFGQQAIEQESDDREGRAAPPEPFPHRAQKHGGFVLKLPFAVRGGEGMEENLNDRRESEIKKLFRVLTRGLGFGKTIDFERGACFGGVIIRADHEREHPGGNNYTGKAHSQRYCYW